MADSTKAGWQSIGSAPFLAVLYLMVTEPFYSMPEAEDIRFKLLTGVGTTLVGQMDLLRGDSLPMSVESFDGPRESAFLSICCLIIVIRPTKVIH